jgi:hypothetical protein
VVRVLMKGFSLIASNTTPSKYGVRAVVGRPAVLLFVYNERTPAVACRSMRTSYGVAAVVEDSVPCRFFGLHGHWPVPYRTQASCKCVPVHVRPTLRDRGVSKHGGSWRAPKARRRTSAYSRSVAHKQAIRFKGSFPDAWLCNI